nr:hypothetical protein [Candidatus Methanofastidiosa archaeon]
MQPEEIGEFLTRYSRTKDSILSECACSAAEMDQAILKAIIGRALENVADKDRRSILELLGGPDSGLLGKLGSDARFQELLD